MRISILFLALISIFTFSSLGQESARKEPVKRVLRPVQQNGRWGYIDNTGKIVIKPQFYWAEEFSEGLASFENDDGDCGYVDETGKIVIEPTFEDCAEFSEGLAAVGKDFKRAYIDHTGKWVIPLQFHGARPFSDGLALVGVPKPGTEDSPLGPKNEWFIDRTGKPVITPENGFLNGVFSEGFGTVQIMKQNGITDAIVDRTGKTIATFEDIQTDGFHNGLAAAKKEGKWGYVNTAGVFVIEPQYEEVGPFSEGLAEVYKDKKTGYIDPRGKVVVPFEFEYNRPDGNSAFSEGLAVVALKDSCGYINTEGKVVIKIQCSYAHNFFGGIAQISVGQGDDEKRGYIDKQGRYIYGPEKFQYMTQEHTNAVVEKRRKRREQLTPLTDQEKALNPRDIIANQPDFVADLEWFYNEGFGGLGGTEHIAHKGDKYREESKYWIFVGEIGKNAIRLNPANKTYTVSDHPKFEPVVGPNAFDPRLLARNSDFSFTSLGTIDQGGHKYLKIEGSNKEGKLKVTIYVALEMKNIIVSAVLSNSSRSISQRIGNISFDVPDSLVEVPADYKKN